MTGDDAHDLYNIPATLWDSPLDTCTPDALLAIQNYLRLQREYARDGKGLFFSGPVGAGKTTAAVQLAKAGMQGWFGHPTDLTIYFTRASLLRDAVRFDHEFGNAGPVKNLMLRVKLLIIDDLDLTDFSDSYFNWKSLVIERAGSHRPTVFTSILSFADLSEVQPTWHGQIGKVLYEVPVAGPNRRAEDIKRTRAELFRPKEAR